MEEHPMEQHPTFEARKRDHIKISLEDRSQSRTGPGFDRIDLIHDALPELDFQDIDLRTETLGLSLAAPYFVSSMTAGHHEGRALNTALAKFAERRGLLMGVGSQRRELSDPEARGEWTELRKIAPRTRFAGNIGLSQLIETPLEKILALVDSLEASLLFVHTNPLQEALQGEGTPRFRGGLEALRRLTKASKVPVVLKEVGCGFSQATLNKLKDSGLAAVDVSGRGGTHWGRVEAARLEGTNPKHDSAWLFSEWGISTVDSLLAAREAQVPFELWASGGVRNGLEVAKLLALGASMVGLAQPWLKAAAESDADQALENFANALDFELKTALFCTGSRAPADLRQIQRWTWRKN